MSTETVSIWDNFKKMDEMDEKKLDVFSCRVGSYDTGLVMAGLEVQKLRGLIVF